MPQGGEGHLTALDVDAIEMAKTEERLRNQGFGPDILTIRRINFANIDEVAQDGKFDLFWLIWVCLQCRLTILKEGFLQI